MKTLFIALIAATFSITALAQEIDLKKSDFTWKAEKKLGDAHTGKILLKSAKAKLQDGKIKSGEFVMDMNSVTVIDLKGKWRKKFLDHIKSADFYQVKKYPTSKLVIDKQISKNEVSGKLTIKDKTQPVKIKFKQEGNTYSGKLTFDRTKYGVIYGSGNFFKELTADKVIKNEVQLDFKVVLKDMGKKVPAKKK